MKDFSIRSVTTLPLFATLLVAEAVRSAPGESEQERQNDCHDSSNVEYRSVGVRQFIGAQLLWSSNAQIKSEEMVVGHADS